MKAIIIEDEPLSAAELRTSLAEVAPYIEVVATASSVAEAVETIDRADHDLIFMDIHLEDGSGFDIFERADISVPVIFITAYDSYALKAFENKGIDYLLKPFGLDDLRRAIDKLGLLSGGGSASAEHGAPAQTRPVYQERSLVHMGAPMKALTTAEGAYFMADGKYLHLMTHDGKDYILDRSLTDADPQLYARSAGIGGHIVIRVSPGGKEYCVYMLDDSDTTYTVKQADGPFRCKPQPQNTEKHE